MMFEHGAQYRTGEHAGPRNQLHTPAVTALTEHPATQSASEARQGAGDIRQAHRQTIDLFHGGVEHAHGNNGREQGWQL